MSAYDLAIDYNTGDLIPAPNLDLSGRSGPDTIEQRIRVRLRIQRGTWVLDPTADPDVPGSGTLGSDLARTMRLPRGRAEIECAAAIKQALEPMTDINVVDVKVTADPQSAHGLQFDIEYQTIIAATGETSDSVQNLSVTIPTA